MPLWEWVTAIAIAGFVMSFVTATVGVGGGLLVMPPLTLIFPPHIAIAGTLPMMLINAMAVMWLYRRSWWTAQAALLVPFTLLGTGIGMAVIVMISSTLTRLFAGLTAASLFVFELRRQQSARSSPLPSTGLRAAYGLGGGIISAVTNIGGIMISLALVNPTIPTETFVGTLATIYFVMTTFKMILFYEHGWLPWSFVIESLPAIPTVLLGSFFGKRLHRHIPHTLFRHIILSIIAISSAALIIVVIPRLVA